MEKNLVKIQKRAKKLNKLKAIDINKDMFYKFIMGLSNMSFIYVHYAKESTINDIENIFKFIGKVCFIDNKEYFVPVHIFRNNEKKYIIGGFFNEDDQIVEYELALDSLEEITITNYDVSFFLMEGILI